MNTMMNTMVNTMMNTMMWEADFYLWRGIDGKVKLVLLRKVEAQPFLEMRYKDD